MITERFENGEWPELISYDHDLAIEHYEPENQTLSLNEYYERTNRAETGYDCLRWLILFSYENNLPFPESYCHSMNPIGKKNIEQLIQAQRARKR